MDRSKPLGGRAVLARGPVASAPCNFGVYSMGDGMPDPESVLDVVKEAGYEGIDLGPVHYLGTGQQLRDRLGDRGLTLAGGWVELNPVDGLSVLDAVLDAFDAAAGLHPVPPRPTLAADGPAAAIAGCAPDLDPAGWEELVGRIDSSVRRCRDRGYEPTFHPHVGTWVESPAQIDRLLAGSDVGLCLDTGHVLLGGAEPADSNRWAPRVNHLHVKDVHLERFTALAEEGAGTDEVWSAEVFCELGSGDAEWKQMVTDVPDFEGWIVVEQDLAARAAQDPRERAASERHNREAVGSIRR